MSLDLPARCLHTPHGCAVTLQAGTVTVARMDAESRGLGPKGWGCPALSTPSGEGPPAQSPAASWRLICQEELP